jgi:hypothetical protein
MIGKKDMLVAFSVAAGLLSLTSGVGAQTDDATGDDPTGAIHRFTGRETQTHVCLTTATESVLIPGTTVKFIQGPGKPEPVVVTFVASWPTPTPSEIPKGSRAAGASILLLIDGHFDLIDNQPLGQVLVHDGEASLSNGTHGFTFITDPIPAGAHEAAIHVLDNVLGSFGVPNGTTCVDARSTVVQHK